MDDSHRRLEYLRARLRDVLASRHGDVRWSQPESGPRFTKRTALILAAVAAFAAIGAGGYLIGASQAADGEAASEVGEATGEARGAALGARQGREDSFAAARERAYDAAYRDSYRAAFLEEFERADLDAPANVRVVFP